MRFSLRTNKVAAGFTLVEVLIIAPVVIIAITGFIALMVTMTADVLVTRDHNALTYEAQDALDRIEQDTRLSTQFLTTSGTLPSPQGSNNNFTGTSAFTNTSSTLILGELTTDKNPLDPARKIVYYAGQPNVCGNQQAYNRVFQQKVMYFIKDGSLWRRAVLPNYNTNAILDDDTLCSAPWQRNTCSPGYSAATRCQTNDIEVMKNVDSFTIKYYDDPAGTVEIGSANALNATTIEVSITGKKTTAGRDLTSSGKIRATKLNNIDVDIPAPGVPDVTGQVVDSTKATFSWAKVPLASSYTISYNRNGGAWTNAVNNSQTTTFTVPAELGDTVTIRVSARNSTGSSAYDEAVTTIPRWNACPVPLQNNWANYENGYADASYTKTSAGVVVLKGLVRSGTATANTPICTLPVGYRPDKRLVFYADSNSAGGRIDVATNGEIRFVTGSNVWISLDSIRFVASSASPTWSTPVLSSPWVDVGSDIGPAQTTLDSLGRVHMRGAVKDGTAVSTIFSLPPGHTKAGQFTYLPVSISTGLGFMGVGGSGGAIVSARTTPPTHFSLQALFYPEPYSGWINFGTPGNPLTYNLQNNWDWINLGNHATPSFTKASDGIVTLKGLIKKATNDDGTIIANLPPGYRPKEQLLTSCVANGGFCRIDIMPNGDVIDRLSPSNGWLSLDNISFLAEQ